MMTFCGRYADGRLTNISLVGGDFEPSVMIGTDLIGQTDERFIAFNQQAGTVVFNTDEGRAVYQVAKDGRPHPREVFARLVSVDRGCEVCRRCESKHHWWCSRA